MSCPAAVQKAAAASVSQRNWNSLRKRAEFLRLQQQGQKWVTPGFIIQVFPCPESGIAQIGFTATKRLGNAVIRNRCKRRLRALCDAEMSGDNITGRQFVLIARSEVLTRDFVVLGRDLRWALRKLGMETPQKIAA